MNKPLCLALLSCLLAAPAAAGDVTLASPGVSFHLPDGWTYEVRANAPGGSTAIMIAPVHEDGRGAASRCLIRAYAAPASFRAYTQAQLNEAYAATPPTKEDFAQQLSAAAGQRVGVAETGPGMLGTNLAYWARSTASERAGPAVVHFATRTYLTQSPAYGWNIQCGTASTTSAADAADAFGRAAPVFDAFFASLRIAG